MAGPFGLLTDLHLPKALRAGLVFVTSDARAAGTAWKRVEKGRPYAGMIVWSEERRRQMSVGDLVIFLEELAQQKDPFAAGVRYAKPRS